MTKLSSLDFHRKLWGFGRRRVYVIVLLCGRYSLSTCSSTTVTFLLESVNFTSCGSGVPLTRLFLKRRSINVRLQHFHCIRAIQKNRLCSYFVDVVCIVISHRPLLHDRCIDSEGWLSLSALIRQHK